MKILVKIASNYNWISLMFSYSLTSLNCSQTVLFMNGSGAQDWLKFRKL